MWRWPTRRSHDRAGAGEAELSHRREHPRRGARRRGADAIHPGYGFLAENSRLRPGGRGGGPDLDRPHAREHRRHGRQGARAPPGAGGRRADPARQRALRAQAILAGLDEAARPRCGFPLLVKAAAGGGGIGMRRVDKPEDLAKVGRGDPGAGGEVVRRRHDLSRAAGAEGAPHRDPGVRLRRRPRRPPVRARMLDPAPLPEDRRGDAVARDCRRRRARAMAEAAVALVAAGALSRRRHHRVRRRCRDRRLLFPRDEHAHPGRASGHRDDHRARSGRAADPARARRGLSVADPGRRSGRAATASNAGSTPRTPPRTSCPRPGR